MNNFEFVMLCVLIHKILLEINYASKLLQKPDFDLSEAARILSKAKNNLKSLRSAYGALKNEAIALASKWGIAAEFQTKRQTRVKKHYDELAADHRFQTREDMFRVSVVFRTLDIVNEQLVGRFKTFDTIAEDFGFLVPKTFLNMSENEAVEQSKTLHSKYPEVLSEKFSIQFINMMSIVKQDTDENMSVKEFLSEVLLKKISVLQGDFSEIIMAFLLFLTLPVSVASAERSFSKLKIIKNYLRNSMSENRLHALSILAIEHQTASKMNIQRLVDVFSEMKVRKRDF